MTVWCAFFGISHRLFIFGKNLQLFNYASNFDLSVGRRRRAWGTFREKLPHTPQKLSIRIVEKVAVLQLKMV